MSNAQSNQTLVPAASIHGYAFTLYRLESETGDEDPDLEATMHMLDRLTDLRGSQHVGVIGDEAAHCLGYLVNDKAESPRDLQSISLTEEERAEIHDKVNEWIRRFERFLESAVSHAPTTEIPPGKLIGGNRELLAEHVGERFENEVRDLTEAASNLCAGSYTSTEFMCLRAVERLLRRYFREKTGEAVPARDWSEALDVVAQRVQDHDDLPEELRILEYLRERRRHLVHPEGHSSREDAETTLLKTYRLADALIEAM